MKMMTQFRSIQRDDRSILVYQKMLTTRGCFNKCKKAFTPLLTFIGKP